MKRSKKNQGTQTVRINSSVIHNSVGKSTRVTNRTQRTNEPNLNGQPNTGTGDNVSFV